MFVEVPEGFGRLWKGSEGSGKAGSGGFPKMLEGSRKFRSVGGGGRCKGSGGRLGRFRKVPEPGACSGGFY